MTTREEREHKAIEEVATIIANRRRGLVGDPTHDGISPSDELLSRNIIDALKERGWDELPGEGKYVEYRLALIKAMYHLHRYVIHAGTNFEKAALALFHITVVPNDISDYKRAWDQLYEAYVADGAGDGNG